MRLSKRPGDPWVRGVLLIALLAFSVLDSASELPNRQRAYGQLMIACRLGDVAAVERILTSREKPNLNVPTVHWTDTPLNTAARKGFGDIVAMLLKSGADPNARGALDQLPLVSAAAGGYASVVRQLLNGGARVDEASGRWRVTALATASRYGHHQVVAVLIAAGADVNRPALGGATALVLARENKHKRVEALLLAAGAK
jgi:ankyrin repeat protein